MWSAHEHVSNQAHGEEHPQQANQIEDCPEALQRHTHEEGKHGMHSMHKKAKIEVKSGKTTFVKVSKKCTINGIAWKRERGARLQARR